MFNRWLPRKQLLWGLVIGSVTLPCELGCDVGVQTAIAPPPTPFPNSTVLPQSVPAPRDTTQATQSDDSDGSSALERKNAEGDWIATAAVLAGRPFPKEVTEAITLSIHGEDYEVNVGGKPDKGTCTMDASTSPRRMVIQGTEGPNTGRTLLAIFEVKDDGTLRVCYDLDGDAYPTIFESTSDNKYFLVDYSAKD